MKHTRNGSLPSAKGSPDYFTGNVRIDMPFSGDGEARVSGATVTFEPGARTAWHTHPLGQTLIITAGKGWTQCDGGPVVELNVGDIVWCPPGHRHWHGGTPTTSMTHVAIAEALNGKVVDWAEHVSDADYLAGPKPAA